MTKILYNTTENDKWTIKYYLTMETKSNLSFYGVMVTSESEDGTYTTRLSDVFPYEHNAMEFLMFLHTHNVTPLSMKDVAMEYLEEKIISC